MFFTLHPICSTITNFKYPIFHRYQKPITSQRLVNFHSTIPSHEILNTYSMRFVVASRYDSGSGFLVSYFKILQEMWSNSIPRRLVGLCLLRAQRYHLGRCKDAKHFWLGVLGKEVAAYRFGGSVNFGEFLESLHELFISHGMDLGRFELKDDIQSICPFSSHQKTGVYQDGDPIEVLTYRGRQSVRFHHLMRRKYGRLFCAFRHDRYFSLRRALLKGVDYRSTYERRRLRFPGGRVIIKRRTHLRK